MLGTQSTQHCCLSVCITGPDAYQVAGLCPVQLYIEAPRFLKIVLICCLPAPQPDG
jgi:hypothetical protein